MLAEAVGCQSYCHAIIETELKLESGLFSKQPQIEDTHGKQGEHRNSMHCLISAC